MPVQYAGIREEHVAVRTAAGVFDVSHMGQIETTGPQAAALLQRLISNDVESLQVGASLYGVLCREDGGIIDDLLTYRLEPDRYLTVTNAANHERDVAWFRKHADGFDAEVADARERYAMLAIQGPRAREIVQATADAPLPARRTVGERRLTGRAALVCGTGYTGEDGVEVLVAPEDAAAVWGEGVRRGAAPGGRGPPDPPPPPARPPRRGAGRPRRARHPAPGAVPAALRQRPLRGPRPDRGRTRVVLQGGHRLHRRRPRSRGARRRPGRAPAPVQAHRPGHPAPRQPGRGRRRRHERDALAVPRDRRRHGLPAGRSHRGRHRDRDRRPGQDPRSRRGRAAPLPQGARWLTPATPTTCSTTPSTTGSASTATRPRSASRGSPRTRSARWSSSTRPRSAAR